jgi:hypothetical protein
MAKNEYCFRCGQYHPVGIETCKSDYEKFDIPVNYQGELVGYTNGFGVIKFLDPETLDKIFENIDFSIGISSKYSYTSKKPYKLTIPFDALPSKGEFYPDGCKITVNDSYRNDDNSVYNIYPHENGIDIF